MTSSHLGVAGADVSIPPPQPRDSTILGKMQILFIVTDKVAAYQDFINEVIRWSNAIESEATKVMITRAWHFAVDTFGTAPAFDS